jgi:hypothetical protein
MTLTKVDVPTWNSFLYALTSSLTHAISARFEGVSFGWGKDFSMLYLKPHTVAWEVTVYI